MFRLLPRRRLRAFRTDLETIAARPSKLSLPIQRRDDRVPSSVPHSVKRTTPSVASHRLHRQSRSGIDPIGLRGGIDRWGRTIRIVLLSESSRPFAHPSTRCPDHSLALASVPDSAFGHRFHSRFLCEICFPKTGETIDSIEITGRIRKKITIVLNRLLDNPSTSRHNNFQRGNTPHVRERKQRRHQHAEIGSVDGSMGDRCGVASDRIE